MFELAKIDLMDAYIFADVFDGDRYTLLAKSDDLETLTKLAIADFQKFNPKFKTPDDWLRDAEDFGWEIELFHEGRSLFRGSMLLVDPRVEKALNLALKYHSGAKRKAGDLPYIIHILEVSALVFNKDCTEADADILCAAICHDLLEDTDCPEQLIVDTCGAEVLRIVKAVSNDPELESNEDWEKKKEAYIASVEAGGEKAMMVCLCDKIANLNLLLRELEKEGESVWENFNRGREKKLWFEKEVLAMLKKNGLESRLMKDYEVGIGRAEAR